MVALDEQERRRQALQHEAAKPKGQQVSKMVERQTTREALIAKGVPVVKAVEATQATVR